MQQKDKTTIVIAVVAVLILAAQLYFLWFWQPAEATNTVDEAFSARDNLVSTLENARDLTHGKMLTIGNTQVVLMWSEIELVPAGDALSFTVNCPENMIPLAPAHNVAIGRVMMSAPMLPQASESEGVNQTVSGWFTSVQNDEILPSPAMVGVFCMSAPQ